MKQKKYRQAKKQFIVEGSHLVDEAYEMGLLEMVFSLKKTHFNNIEEYLVTQEIINKISDVKTPQGIIGVCRMKEDQVVKGNVLLLDRLQDPGNMGTLLRSAVAFGFENIVVDQSVDVYNPKVIRATQGAIFKVNMIEDDILKFINQHKHIQFLATDLSSVVHLEDIKVNHGDIGVILGNEGNGVRQEIIQASNLIFKLKMHNMESLNAGVAGSIIMYYLGGSR
ncbi:RNA methyltransferase [Mycoplasmatota bacterium]|nr:RNA methyltransferase [Mycoplasmatota bacterium]